jgi:hypothetical protein
MRCLLLTALTVGGLTIGVGLLGLGMLGGMACCCPACRRGRVEYL